MSNITLQRSSPFSITVPVSPQQRMNSERSVPLKKKISRYDHYHFRLLLLMTSFFLVRPALVTLAGNDIKFGTHTHIQEYANTKWVERGLLPKYWIRINSSMPRLQQWACMTWSGGAVGHLTTSGFHAGLMKNTNVFKQRRKTTTTTEPIRI